MKRIIKKLAEYAPPEIEIVTKQEQADLVVEHVYNSVLLETRWINKILHRNQSYALIQFVFGSNGASSNPHDWQTLWKDAKVVWSYYDLEKFIGDNFYHAPLGVDPHSFYIEPVEKKYIVGYIGNNIREECNREIESAAQRLKKNYVHVGIDTNRTNYKTHVNYTDSDNQLRTIYNQCKWFSGLRRYDGFEMPVLEAILCGSRPIVFDTPNYRQWFDGLAVFIPERSAANVISDLINILMSEPKPITALEIEEIKRRFNWKDIIEGFWHRILQ